jgi:addiction module HigA family antidote
MVVKRLPAFAPPHPGEMLRDDILPRIGMTPSEAARRLNVSRQALHAVLSGKTGLSPEMAVRVSRLFGSSPSHWLAIQAAHDLWHVEQAGEEAFSRIERVA